MRPRILVLPAAALVIAALCAWRVRHPDQSLLAGGARPELKRPAIPLDFSLHTQHSPPQIVRLKPYLGRHSILVIFYDGQAGADRSPVLRRLHRDRDRLKSAGVKVMAISDALPPANRAALDRLGGLPFPLLSDVTMQVHEQWGRLDADTGRPLAGVFVIDRAGNITWPGRHPEPAADPEAAIDELLND